MKKIVFVCFANRIRSQMAEGFGWHLAGDRYLFDSAGISPGGSVFPDAARAMAERGIDIAGYQSQGLDEVDWDSVSLLVSLLDIPAARLVPGYKGATLDRPAPDPVGKDYAAYQRTRDRVEEIVKEVISSMDSGRNHGG